MKKIILLLFFVIISSLVSYNYGQQKVKASYYANKFHGRKTASGQLYHKDSLTCAHKTYPFGTILKVTNPKNSKETYVKVTDRGPFIKGRSIDLSYAAAKKIGIIGHGVASVLYEKVDSSNYFLNFDGEITPRVRMEMLEKMTSQMKKLELVSDNTYVNDSSIKLSNFLLHKELSKL